SRASRSVDLEVVLQAGAPPHLRRPMPFDVKLFLGLERVMFRLLARVTGRPPTGPLSRVSLDAASNGGEGPVHADADALLAHVRDLHADLVLLHGAAGLAPALSTLARHGCWVLDPDITDPDRAGLVLLAP